MGKINQLISMPWYKLAFQVIGVGFALYIFAPLVFSSLQANDEVEENSTQPSIKKLDVGKIEGVQSLSSRLLILEDKKASLKIEDLLNTDEKALFKPVEGELNFGFTQSVFWTRIDLVNKTDSAKSLILRQNYPLIDSLDFWQIKNKNIHKHIETGDQRKFDSREVKHKDFLFVVDIAAQESQTLFLRYQSSGSLNIGLSFNTNSHLLSQSSDEQLAFGAYYGGVLVLAIYNMFLFFAAKEKAFTHYLWYLISYGIYMSTHNGFAFQYLWPDNPWLANHSLLLSLAATLFWGLKFSQEIVSSAIYAPRVDRAATGLQYFSIALFVGSFVLPYEMMILSLSVATVMAAITIFTMGIISLLARYKPALFFMIAWSTFLVAVLIYMLKTFGALPHNGFTQNAFQIASLIEMTLLSVALAHHFSELKKKSYTDALTFLYNRRHFDDKFDAEFSQARKGKQELSLLVMDIDHFKKFNDNYGHAEGDKVIQFVASVLKNNVRKPLIPCRYGGEEFAVILPRTPKESAMVLAERIREKVELESDREKPVTISVGVASVNDTRESGVSIISPRELFEAADDALYQAKDNGRNRVQDFAKIANEELVEAMGS